jgi:putative endonuclease
MKSARTTRDIVRSDRRKAEQAGRRAEWLCAMWLRLCGYRIIQTRYRCPVGEIDIIVKKGNLIAAIEVKNRANLDDALHALRPKQQQRIARALSNFASNIGHHGDLRFDIIAVRNGWRIRHLKNAWML